MALYMDMMHLLLKDGAAGDIIEALGEGALLFFVLVLLVLGGG